MVGMESGHSDIDIMKASIEGIAMTIVNFYESLGK